MNNSFLRANFDLRKDAKYGGKPPARYRVVLVDWETHQLIDKFRDKLTVTQWRVTPSGVALCAVNYKGSGALKSCFTEFRLYLSVRFYRKADYMKSIIWFF